MILLDIGGRRDEGFRFCVAMRARLAGKVMEGGGGGGRLIFPAILTRHCATLCSDRHGRCRWKGLSSFLSGSTGIQQ